MDDRYLPTLLLPHLVVVPIVFLIFSEILDGRWAAANASSSHLLRVHEVIYQMHLHVKHCRQMPIYRQSRSVEFSCGALT